MQESRLRVPIAELRTITDERPTDLSLRIFPTGETIDWGGAGASSRSAPSWTTEVDRTRLTHDVSIRVGSETPLLESRLTDEAAFLACQCSARRGPGHGRSTPTQVCSILSKPPLLLATLLLRRWVCTLPLSPLCRSARGRWLASLLCSIREMCRAAAEARIKARRRGEEARARDKMRRRCVKQSDGRPSSAQRSADQADLSAAAYTDESCTTDEGDFLGGRSFLVTESKLRRRRCEDGQDEEDEEDGEESNGLGDDMIDDEKASSEDSGGNPPVMPAIGSRILVYGSEEQLYVGTVVGHRELDDGSPRFCLEYEAEGPGGQVTAPPSQSPTWDPSITR